jgi:hypothetical protein
MGGWVDPRASLDDTEKRKFLTLLGTTYYLLFYKVLYGCETWSFILRMIANRMLGRIYGHKGGLNIAAERLVTPALNPEGSGFKSQLTGGSSV